MEYPTVRQLPTTWKVTFIDGQEIEFGTLRAAVEAAQEVSDTITFIPWERTEKAPYTGSLSNDMFSKSQRRPF